MALAQAVGLAGQASAAKLTLAPASCSARAQRWGADPPLVTSLP
jgi:hypothetical protein